MSEPEGATELELQIVELCGLSKLLAPGLLRRALVDAGAANPPQARDLLRALPMLEGRMRAYLTPEEVLERSQKMRRLLDAAPDSTLNRLRVNGSR